jgi:hypothetical protein
MNLFQIGHGQIAILNIDHHVRWRFGKEEKLPL